MLRDLPLVDRVRRFVKGDRVIIADFWQVEAEKDLPIQYLPNAFFRAKDSDNEQICVT